MVLFSEAFLKSVSRRVEILTSSIYFSKQVQSVQKEMQTFHNI